MTGFRADLLVALVLTATTLVEFAVDRVDALTGISAALLMTLPLAWRRRAPEVTALLVVFGLAILPPAAEETWIVPFASFFLAFYSLGAYGESLRSAAVLALAMGFTSVSEAIDAGSFRTAVEGIVFVGVVEGGFWGAGRLVRRDRRRAAELQELTVALQCEREEKARLAVVALYGGELEAGPEPDGGYRVRARLSLGEGLS